MSGYQIMGNMKLRITAIPLQKTRPATAPDQLQTHFLKPLQHCERNVHRKTVNDVV
jgi:hypothetical protein